MESPFIQKLGFNKLISSLEKEAKSSNSVLAGPAQYILSNLNHKEVLQAGLEDLDNLKPYKNDINLLLNQLFPNSLLNNEIKIATTPFNRKVLFRSDRFKQIFGEQAVIEFGDQNMFQSDDDRYIMSCTWILKAAYGVDFHFINHQFCTIQANDGINHYYKSLINADFYELFHSTGKKPKISEEDIQELLHNSKDIKLWKKHFPPGSWIISGFGIMNLYDATSEYSLSRFKDLLISKNQFEKDTKRTEELQDILKSYLSISDLRIDLLLYDNVRDHLLKIDNDMPCIGAPDGEDCQPEELFCQYTKKQLFLDHENLVLADIPKMIKSGAELGILKVLDASGFQSYLAAPIMKDNKLLGILEFASNRPYVFNDMTQHNINKFIPIVEASIQSFVEGKSNKLSAIIQNECTAIHSSVEWKFYEEAEKFFDQTVKESNEPKFDEIVFNDLYALYGQIDVSGSSKARNGAIANDLSAQLEKVLTLLKHAELAIDMPLIRSVTFQTNILKEQVNSELASGVEQEVITFLKNEVNPLLDEISKFDIGLADEIKVYRNLLHPELGIIYNQRKNYDQSMEFIGKTMSSSIDKKQKAAQHIFPHYFERYKTDGVEHNMFIGQEIAPHKTFEHLYLHNLHLWQLKTMCEMEIEHRSYRDSLPMPLDVASLIMVYNTPLSIRYRMDEKQFDVDGAYNARYEIIKKRIDKAYIKGTTQRITEPGKMVIVFTQQKDLEEYRTHINYLIYEGLLQNDLEVVNVQDLQGVSGLRAIRVSVNYDQSVEQSPTKIRVGQLESN